MNATLRNNAAQAVRDCLDRDQADDDSRPLELWIADSVLALASDEKAKRVGETVARIILGVVASLMLLALCWAAYLSGPSGRTHAVLFFGVLAVLTWFEWRRGKRLGAA